MKTMPDWLKIRSNPFAIGISVGLIVGLGIGLMIRRQTSSERYTLKTIPDSPHIKAIKMDVKTGEIWQMDRSGDWTKSY